MAGATTHVEKLEKRLRADWPNLRKARAISQETREELRTALAGLNSADTSIVVSGSLARDEFTKEGSDVDWTLLIDGAADYRHHNLFLKIQATIERLGYRRAGAEKTFDSMVFSHGLIHEIGGEDDTNRNTTRRVLLLLESHAVGQDLAYRSVVRNILKRYLLEDRGLWKGSGYPVPRFLLNDLARYWRTMAVDFAYKLRKRGGDGWAIRNIKLRMSRKLIYVSGLLACYRFHLSMDAAARKALFSGQGWQQEVVELFEMFFAETPLEIVAGTVLEKPSLAAAAKKIFSAYDEFIGILADEVSRKRLDDLTESEADEDALYQRARRLSHDFRDGLRDFFFDSESGLEELTKNYGVF